ncbi:MAG: type II toxin-antitoxin system RelE family toxin [Alphaproteobacteria bacterium]
MVLLLSPAAVKALIGMQKRERAHLKARLDKIAAAPTELHASVTALQGKPRGRFRLRQGDYRAVFRLDGQDVVVDRIGHRREVYER